MAATARRHLAPAIDQLLAQARTTVSQLEAPIADISWDNFVTPLELVTEKLGRAWGIVSHLNSVKDTPELRAAYNEVQPKVTEFWTAIGQNLQLYQNYKALAASPEYAKLSSARQKIINDALRDFTLTWVNAHHGGWENDEGGDGTVTLYVPANHCQLAHSECYTERNDYAYSL